MAEQRHPYKGRSIRSWLRLGFKAPDGSTHQFDFVADTGCPLAIIIRADLMARLTFSKTTNLDSNFGNLRGGWLRLYSPEMDFVEFVEGYGSDAAAAAVAQDHPDFMGLVGLPILRLGEYGGNANDFWFRYPT